MSRHCEYQAPWFHKKLIDGLIESGISVPQVAKRARISKSYAYKIFYELQYPSVPVMMRLEDVLGFERGALVRAEQSPY